MKSNQKVSNVNDIMELGFEQGIFAKVYIRALLIDDNSLATIDRGQLHADQLSLVAIGAMNRRRPLCLRRKYIIAAFFP